MGSNKKRVEEAEVALEKARAEMHDRNVKHLADLDRTQPTPTVEELQRSMGVVFPEKKVAPEERRPPVEEKTSEPQPISGGSYKTRTSRP